jgi:hypothetical protein
MERFYARNLSLSPELAKNLRALGSDKSFEWNALSSTAKRADRFAQSKSSVSQSFQNGKDRASAED